MRELSMRYIFAIITLSLTACSTIEQIATTCPGLRPYDPQMCRGEYFQQLPNFENEALIRRQRGEIW
jgi:hypothetical protein